MQTIGEMTFNAMIYVFFVAFSGGMGLVVAGLVGYKMFNRSKAKATAKAAAKPKTWGAKPKNKGAF